MAGLLLSHRHPLLYALAVRAYRLRRALRWRWEDLRGVPQATLQRAEPLPVRVKKHESRLLRRLGDSPAWLQRNKVHNLALALRPMDGLLLRPGERFSFWRRVGRPSAARGYILGMELSRGRARAGIGGGICQLASVLHWLALHSPLEVVERSTHSFDPFPDQGRSLPYGTGAAVFYNYIDLQLYNPTERTFQFSLRLTDRFLVGELRCDAALPQSYTVIERDHAFVREGETWYRQNSLWRRVHARGTGVLLREELVKRNRVRVLYQPDEGAGQKGGG